MSGNTEVYYWDSCLFLAWLKNEPREKEEMDGVRDVIERVRRREAKIVTSVLTITEVGGAELPAGSLNLFTELLKRPGVTKISVDVKIAKLATEIRDYYRERPDKFNNKTVGTPDSIDLATAILFRVTEFHTFDRKNKGGTLGLLHLSGNVGGHNLVVTKPVAAQPGLDL
jgi:predicted nucleic acid-binding protein